MSAAETTQIEYDLKITDGPSTVSGTETHVIEFDVVEGISEIFTLDLLVAYADVELDLRSLMGKEAVLTLVHDEGDRHFHGIVAEAEELEETANFTRYKFRIVPRMWLLKHQRESRIFQGKTTPEILADVFDAVGVRGDWLDDRTNSSFEARDYCVQYRESSFAFACRLMEEDGICFWFEHSDDGHVLVLADDSADFVSVPSPAAVPFEPPGMGTVGEQHAWRFRATERVRPGKTTLIDYSFKQPTQDMEKSHEGDHDTDLEIYDFPGGYVGAGLGTTLAQVRHEELQVRRTTARGNSTVTRLMAGHLFELKEHPNNNLNVEYLLLRVHHRGQRNDPGTGGADGEGEYSNNFEVMPSEVAYRPPRRTPVPQISGLQTAIVTGPEGEEIYVDEFGRVKVQFHWDRQGEGDDASSCWIRVSQGWAGAGFGQVYIPRIGQEVIVQFIEGDPDRPLVTGRVYNGDNALPYPLPDNKTVSTMKSKSSKDDDGFNEFRFEDKAGSEEIYLHAQKDFNEEVLNCHTTDVGADQTNTVHNNQTERVDVDQEMSVGGNRTVHIEGNFEETVDGTETRTVTGDVTEDFAANETRTVGANHDETVSGDAALTISGNQDRTVTGNVTDTILGSLDQTVVGGVKVTTPAAFEITAAGGFKVTAPAGVQVIAPGGQTQIDSFWSQLGGFFDCKWASQYEVVGIKNAIVGAEHSTKGFDASIVATKLENGVFQCTTVGTAIKNAASKIGTAALEVGNGIYIRP
jgi:type VI secretion system secreted protein VgrG